MSLIKNLIEHLPDSPRKKILKFYYLRKFRRAKISDDYDLAALSKLISPGQTALDLGANFGLYTRFISEAVGENGHVFSFEPTSDMFDVLHNNIASPGLSNTTCINAALSDQSGEAEIHIPKHEDGGLNYYEASLVPASDEANLRGETIQMITLDEFCEQQNITSLHFIKCDVEGHEIAVLRGAMGVIQRDKPTILLEINDAFDDNANGTDVVNFIKEMGYEFHIYEDDKIQPWKKSYAGVNYILYPTK